MFDDPVEQYSPNKSYRLTFHDFAEPRMGMSICRFSLTNLSDHEYIDFDPLWAIGFGKSGFSWSENQNFLSLPVVDLQKDSLPAESFFIYNIQQKQFSSIHFENCWLLNGKCGNQHIEIEYEDNQIPERIEHNKYPTKKFTKPANLKFKFTDLKWADINALQQFNELNSNPIIHELKPIDNGWRPFNGELPKTTEILIWELEKFAEYGDSQSNEWLKEINAKTDKINYWVNTSHYLGFKTRGSF